MVLNVYTNQDIPSCSTSNCTNTDIEASILYIESNCSISHNNTTSLCTDTCQRNWNIIASFQRQCIPYPLDYLYTESASDCLTDCTLSSDTEYTVDCPNSTHTNYSKLDINELEKDTKFCFYGLNIDDPYDYVFVFTDY
eukprot:768449_1